MAPARPVDGQAANPEPVEPSAMHRLRTIMSRYTSRRPGRRVPPAEDS